MQSNEQKRRLSVIPRNSVQKKGINMLDIFLFSQNSPLINTTRQSKLLAIPNNFLYKKSQFMTDEQFRQTICQNMLLIYLFILEIIQVRRTTENCYSIRFKINKKFIKKCHDSLKIIQQYNISNIVYLHSKFVSAIYNYVIDDILKKDKNSIYQGPEISEDSERDEIIQVVDTINGKNSGYTFDVKYMKNYLKKLMTNEYCYYIQSSLKIYQPSFNQQDFKYEQPESEKSKLINQIIKTTLKSSNSIDSIQNSQKEHDRNNTKNQHQKQKSKFQSNQSNVQKDKNINNFKIMKDGKYIVKFDSTTKRYYNPFRVKKYNKKDKVKLNSVQKVAQLIQDINVYFLKMQELYASFSLKQCFTMNPILSICLIGSIFIGILGILLFKDYYARLTIVLVCSIVSICGIVHSVQQPLPSFQTQLCKVQKLIKKRIKNQSLSCIIEVNKESCQIQIQFLD